LLVTSRRLDLDGAEHGGTIKKPSDERLGSALHRYGDGESEPPISALPSLYDELEEDDDIEHESVTVTHDSGWSLSAYGGGYVIFGHLDRAETERHMNGVSRDDIVRLWTLLANGDIDAVAREPWKPGYGP